MSKDRLAQALEHRDFPTPEAFASMSPKEIMAMAELMDGVTQRNIERIDEHFNDVLHFNKQVCRTCMSPNVSRSKSTQYFHAHYCADHYPNEIASPKPKQRTISEIFGEKL